MAKVNLAARESACIGARERLDGTTARRFVGDPDDAGQLWRHLPLVRLSQIDSGLADLGVAVVELNRTVGWPLRRSSRSSRVTPVSLAADSDNERNTVLVNTAHTVRNTGGEPLRLLVVGGIMFVGLVPAGRPSPTRSSTTARYAG
jgi:hypothetical protein